MMFVSMETAVMRINRSKVKADAEDENPRAVLLQKQLDASETFLAALQIAITILMLSIVAVALFSYVPNMLDGIQTFIVAAIVLSAIAVIIPATIFSKRFAQLYATKLAYSLIKPTSAFAWIVFPLAKLFSLCVDLFIKLAMHATRKEDSEGFIEEEIRMMADEASESGEIDDNELKMIHNVFDFDTKTAEEISVHRMHMCALDIDSTIEEIAQFITVEKFTRIPVYEENLDNILGLLYTKDILEHLLASNSLSDFDFRAMLREPYFVPSSKKVDELFVEMKKKQVHMVIVVDEYGGTVGLVTMEDIVEEIMGSILDEYDEQETPDISRIDDSTFIMMGMTPLKDVAEYFDEHDIEVDLPTEDYDTLGGFLIGQLGHIPEEAEKPLVSYEGLLFRIVETQEKRISKVIVKKEAITTEE